MQEELSRLPAAMSGAHACVSERRAHVHVHVHVHGRVRAASAA